jgi:hypothetical protein
MPNDVPAQGTRQRLMVGRRILHCVLFRMAVNGPAKWGYSALLASRANLRTSNCVGDYGASVCAVPHSPMSSERVPLSARGELIR